MACSQSLIQWKYFETIPLQWTKLDLLFIRDTNNSLLVQSQSRDDWSWHFLRFGDLTQTSSLSRISLLLCFPQALLLLQPSLSSGRVPVLWLEPFLRPSNTQRYLSDQKCGSHWKVQASLGRGFLNLWRRLSQVYHRNLLPFFESLGPHSRPICLFLSHQLRGLLLRPLAQIRGCSPRCVFAWF